MTKFVVKVSAEEQEALSSKDIRVKVSSSMFRPRLLSRRAFMSAVGKLAEAEKAAGRARIGAERLDKVISCYLPNGNAHWVEWIARELGVLPSDVLRNLLRDIPLNTPLPHYSLARLRDVLGHVKTPDADVRVEQYRRSGDDLGRFLRTETNRYVLREFYTHPALLENPRTPLSVLVETRRVCGVNTADPLVENYMGVMNLWSPEWVE